MEKGTERRLAAIMFTDLVGYTRMTQDDEELALELLEEHRDIVREELPKYGGVENKTIGDAFLIEFKSAVEAVRCAIEIQTRLHERNQSVPDDRVICMRVGIHVGDVLDRGADTYGEGVNIASRIEPISWPGGVCLTGHVLGHLGNNIDLPIKKIGLRRLKNIKEPVELHRIVFHWEKSHNGRIFNKIGEKLDRFFEPFMSRLDPRLKKLNNSSLAVASVAIGLIFLSTVLLTKVNIRDYDPGKMDRLLNTENRSDVHQRRTYIKDGWKYVIQSIDSTPEEIASLEDNLWSAFSFERPWLYRDQVHGEYWLKKTFRIDKEFKHPAMVLGLARGFHRAYLNGRFIGGGNHYRELSYYTFDNSLLKKNDDNIILIKAKAKKSLVPGLLFLPNVGAFIGEFNTVHGIVYDQGFIQYHLKHSIYLVLSFLMFLACFIYFLFHSSRREYLYFSIFLLLASTTVLYTNMYVNSALGFQFLRYIKLVSIFISSAVLFSVLLYVTQRRALEFYNNVFIICSLGVLTAVMLPENISPNIFADAYQKAFQATSIYNIIWISFGFLIFGLSLYHKKLSSVYLLLGRARPRIDYQVVILVTGTLTGLGNFASTWTGFSDFIEITQAQQSVLSNIGLAFPLFFSLSIAAIIIHEYIESVHSVDERRKRDELILKILRLVNETKDFHTSVAGIQENVCRFLGAERSTLYLWESDGHSTGLLKARHIYGGNHHTRRVKLEVATDTGILGHVFKYRKSLLIKDISEHANLMKINKRDPERKDYRTKSCMIFPLMVQGEFHGILTVADRMDHKSFDEKDFFLMSKVAKDLSLIIRNTQLEEKRKSHVKGLISALRLTIERHNPNSDSRMKGILVVAQNLAKELGIQFDGDLKVTLMLHDIGKLLVPDRILSKPLALNAQEREVVEHYPIWSFRILDKIPGFQDIARWAHEHQERPDGSGYPYGLRGDSIAPQSLLVGLADQIDSLATNQPHRKRMSEPEIILYLEEEAKKGRIQLDHLEAAIKVVRSDVFRRAYTKVRTKGYQDPIENIMDFYGEHSLQFNKDIAEFRLLLENMQENVGTGHLEGLRSLMHEISIHTKDIEELVHTIQKRESA